MDKNVLDKDEFASLKLKLKEIYDKSCYIHLDLTARRKKLTDVLAKIEGIYDRFLCVTSTINKYKEDFTISYIDILTNKIIIKELNNK